MADYASSSRGPSSDAVLEGTYDVFLSFRAEDTRYGFVSHLYKALKHRGIHTFRDDERLERGRPIRPELLKTIKDSKIAIIVFSPRYADSSWCLDELVEIVKSEPQKIVMPVFYHVEPTDIRKQKNVVADASPNFPPEQMQGWKAALTRAADVAGWHVGDRDDESECIEDIVEWVFRHLRHTVRSARTDLIGMDWRMDKVLKMVREEDSNTVRIIGIYGLGGSGKTTLAYSVYQELKSRYHSSCFLTIDFDENLNSNGIKNLQETFIRGVLNAELPITNKEEGIYHIKSKLKTKKVLIVLDNVFDVDQLEALAVAHDSFGRGSRVIITTRDFGLLKNADEKYKIDLLNKNEATQLFRKHAFENNVHPDESFADLSKQAVEYSGGLP